MSETPKRKFTVEMSIGADTFEDMVSLLKHFLGNIQSGSRSCVSGGYSNGGHYTVKERPEVTHDSHAAAIEEWLMSKGKSHP